jgi:LysM repeat protein
MVLSAGGDGAEGAEVIYALRNNSNLASNILTALGNAGQIMRKYYQRRLPSDTSKDYYFIHRDTGSKTEPVIVEYGFIDNPTDLAKIQNNYKKYVDAVVEAVIASAKGKKITSIPSGSYYVVKSGDSLWSIANKYKTTVDNLKSLNNLTSNILNVGQILKLPGTTVETANTYTVKSGDNLWSIAGRYNTTVSALKTLNNLTSDSLSIGQVLKLPTAPVETSNVYTVKAGDSLWNIANRYNTTVSTLKTLNNLTSDNLSIGQVLKLPGSSANTYTVKSGDSLWSIASRYNTTVSTLKALNNLTSNLLSIGQIIKLP